ncbi:hypothetical protein GCM10025868_24610 [Angustibacter aerolatus]|uniref:Stealth protein CR1 conserved region 1 domain-containing protein n=1 Tax=Angustibacter aerolatus TaxID=1162965 RepID=A0ABQ6JI49_9ACTN|nr:hypothetical protein GCM10025868_24610 [Angustibacter aerolatus]
MLGALTADGVPVVVVDAPTNRRRVVAVAARDADAALAALQRAARGRPVHVSRVVGRSVGRPVPIERLGTLGPHLVWRVHEPWCSPSGSPLAGSAFGCDLGSGPSSTSRSRRWSPARSLAPGTLVAPRRNRWTDVLDPRSEPLSTEVDGVPRRGLPAVGAVHELDVTFPVDAVYTWVDGADPAWRERKQAALAAAGRPVHEFAANSSRFTSLRRACGTRCARWRRTPTGSAPCTW